MVRSGTFRLPVSLLKPHAFVPVAIGISIGYLIMTVPLGALLDRIEKRQAVAR